MCKMDSCRETAEEMREYLPVMNNVYKTVFVTDDSFTGCKENIRLMATYSSELPCSLLLGDQKKNMLLVFHTRY